MAKNRPVLTRFPTKTALTQFGISNPYDLAQLTEKKVFLAWSPAMRGRAYRAAHWTVIHIGFRTDPKSPNWQYHGQKTFSTALSTAEEQLALAKAWATQRYKIDGWVKDPFGSYQAPDAIVKTWEKLQ